MHHPTDKIAHTTAFVTPVVEHWLEREIAQWVHPMKDRSDDPSHHGCLRCICMHVHACTHMQVILCVRMYDSGICSKDDGLNKWIRNVSLQSMALCNNQF